MRIRPSLVSLLAATADGQGGNLPTGQSGITTSRKGIQVTAYGTDFDGNKGTPFSLCEQGGVSDDLTITFPSAAKFTTATPVNLRGAKTGEPLKITDGKRTIHRNAYAPASFILN
jgi:hypothetical protein